MVTLGGFRGSIVVQAQISADGLHLLARTESGSLLLWNAANGSTGPEVPKSEHGWMLCAVLSPDGRRFALSTDSGWAGLMDAATGKPVAPLVGHSLRVLSVAFSADGKCVLTGSADRTARIWEVERGKPIATLVGHRDDVRSVAFSSGGKEALTVSADGSAKLWDVPGDDLLGSQEASISTKEIRAVVFSPNGKRLLSAGYDNIARVWDASTGLLAPVAELKGHEGIVVAAAFSGDGERVVTGSFDETVRVWDARTWRETAKLGGYNSWAGSLGMDEARLISAGADWTVRTWDMSPAPLSIFRIPGERREVIALSRDGRLVAVPDAKETVNILGVADGKLRASLGVDTERVRYAAFAPDGRRILLIRENDVVRHYKTVKVWDVAGQRPLVSLSEGADDVEVASFSADGTRVVSGHGDGRIRVWDADTGSLLASLSDTASPISAVAFSPDSERIVVGRRDGAIQVWDAHLDTRTPEQLATFVEQRVPFQLRDGRLLPMTTRSVRPTDEGR